MVRDTALGLLGVEWESAGYQGERGTHQKEGLVGGAYLGRDLSGAGALKAGPAWRRGGI